MTNDTNNTNNTNNTKITVQKPCLKWVGGKTQILEAVMAKFPATMNNYHEIFLGGGSVLLAALTFQKEGKLKIKKKIYASDTNKGLINVYNAIQKNHAEVYDCISKHVEAYDSLTGNVVNRKPSTLEEAQSSKESYYFWVRQQFNEFVLDSAPPSAQHAAMFLFLNKTGFRGMYREGPKGFNVPYGHYKKTPTIVTQDDLRNISDLIQPVVFVCQDFAQSMAATKKGDFVYLDPPYAPENTTSFVKYNADGFDLDTHNRLFEHVKKINSKKIQFLMNNARVDLVLTNFSDCQCDDIVARRAINSKNPGSTTTEVIVSNYP